MAIDLTTHKDVRFPELIAWGASVGPEFFTPIASGPSGAEIRTPRFQYERFRANVSHNIKSQSEFDEIVGFFRIMLGRTYTFRYKDHTDFKIGGPNLDTPQFIAQGDGATQLFDVVKRYTKDGELYERPIQGLVSGTVRVFTEDGSTGINEIFSGFTIDLLNGQINFSSAPASNVNIYVIAEFDVICRFVDNRISISHSDYNNYNFPDINVLEVKKTTA